MTAGRRQLDQFMGYAKWTVALIANVAAQAGVVWAEEATPDIRVEASRRASVSALWGASAGTVATVDEADIEDRQATRIEALVEQLGGTSSVSNAGLATAIQVRGFDISSQIQYNGHPDIQRLFVRDLATVERVEVLKGHLGVLYGQGAPGGTVNYVGKRPHDGGFHQVSVSADSAGGARLVADLENGPSDSVFSWRLVGAGQVGDTWMKNVPRDSHTVFGSFNWRLPGSGDVRLELEHQQNKQPFSFGTVYANGRFMYDRSYVAPAARSDRRYDRLGLYWDQAVADGWMLRASWSASQVHRDEVLAGFWGIQDARTLSGYYRKIDDHARQYDGQVSLGREFRLCDWRHDVQIGMRQDTQAIDFVGLQNIAGFSMDMEAPDFSGVDFSSLPLTRRVTRERQMERGWFVADRMRLGEQLSFMAGLRHATLTIDTDNAVVTQRAADVSHTLGALGAAYTVAPGVTTYATYGESFEPNRGITRSGAPLPPRTGRQAEAGVHLGITDYVNVAAFDLQQDNLTATDPLDPTAKIAIGQVASRGAEVAFRQRLDTDWRVEGQAVVQRVVNERKTSATYGSGVAAIPARHGSLTLAHRAGHLEFWGSVALVGRRWGNPQNTFQAQGYGRIDIGGRHHLGTATELLMVVRNLADLRYVDYLDSDSNVYQGDRRTLTLTLVHRL